ncbi:MAG: hypothetical protein M1522_04845, partial [Actinobacteria bacterium]|nr:hypothetical protein [Actinomycetota bacterium]
MAANPVAIREVVKEEWAYLVGLLPANLDELAVTTGALRRRRAVTSGEDLLRLCLACSLEDWSLRQTAAMAQMMGWQAISDVAVLKRLRACAGLLKELISGVLARRLEAVARPALRVCLGCGRMIPESNAGPLIAADPAASGMSGPRVAERSVLLTAVVSQDQVDQAVA